MKITATNRSIYLNICEFFAFLFYLYINWYKEVYGNNPLLLYGLAAILTGLVLAKSLMDGIVIRHNKSILNTFLAFAVYSLIIGVIVAENKYVLIDTVETLFAFIIVCADYIYICKEKNSINWLLRILALTAVICTVQTVFFGVPFNNGKNIYVTTMSKANNPNNLSVVFLLGIFAISERKKFVDDHFILHAILMVVFIYSIILTGSRKTFIACALYIVMWALKYLKPSVSDNVTNNTVNKLILFLLLIVALIVLDIYFSGTSMYLRLSTFLNNGVNDIRILLYKEAFEFWKSSPLFGIGLGNFLVKSRYHLYSHSSYAEVLACSGIFGFSIFYFPFIRRTSESLKCLFRKNTSYDDYIFSAMFICELFIGLGIIFVYSFNQLMILSVIFYYSEIKLKSVDVA